MINDAIAFGVNCKSWITPCLTSPWKVLSTLANIVHMYYEPKFAACTVSVVKYWQFMMWHSQEISPAGASAYSATGNRHGLVVLNKFCFE